MTLLPAGAWYTAGPYGLFSSQWGKGALKPAEFASSIEYDPATFAPNPKGVRIRERWPAKGTGSPRGWSSAQWNRYFGTGTTPRTILPATRIGDLAKLVVSYDTEIEGDAAGLIDMFGTATPNAPPLGDECKFELEVFTNPNASGGAWARGGKLIGDMGNAKIYLRYAGPTPIFYYVYNSPRNSGSFDVRAFLTWAASKGFLTGREYVAGLGLGMEPHSGVSSMLIRDMRVSYCAAGKSPYC